MASDIGTPAKYSREFTDTQKAFLKLLGTIQEKVDTLISKVEVQILAALKATTSDPPNPSEIKKLY